MLKKFAEKQSKMEFVNIDELVPTDHILRKIDNVIDFKPVVKFFGGGAFTWLITEYDEENELFFGLCDLGQGFPELGSVSREELESVRFPPFGLPVERDLYWTAKGTLSEYTTASKRADRIVEL